MTWFMSIAAGAAIGYFLFRFILKNNSDRAQEENGEGGEAGTSRRLHKSSKNKMIAGVCGGLAEYLNADPTIVRLAAVLLMCGWGSGLLIYIICAIVMPEE